MRVRYDNWVEGLSGDWLISRQRFFGVPLPIWYAVDDDGDVQRDQVITPALDALPRRPHLGSCSRLHRRPARKPGGFVGEQTFLDTGATSSLTPQLPVAGEHTNFLNWCS
jgi:Valyl-tRNA synthetase